MIHKKLISLLVLLVATATGAWADHTVKWEGETLQSVSVLQYGGKVTTETMTIDGITVTANNGYMKYVDGIDLYSADATGLVFSAEDNIKSIKITSIGESKFTSSGNYVSSGGTQKYTVSPEAKSYALEAGVHIKVIKSIEFTLDGDAPVEVTTNVAEGDTCFTQASFAMPYYNTNVEYELARDMAYKVGAEITEHIRIKKGSNNYELHKPDQLKLVVADTIDAAHPDTLVIDEDYVKTLQKKNGDSWVDVNVTAPDWYPLDTFRYVVRGRGLYDGVINSNEFVLYEGFSVTVPGEEFITYYRDEALTVEDGNAELYTITAVSGSNAVAAKITTANANTPFLVYNKSNKEKTFILIPVDGPVSSQTYYSGFKGTLKDSTITASTATKNNYAFNGLQFVKIRNDLAIGANKCWLTDEEGGTGGVEARAINLVFDSQTTGITTTDYTDSTDDAIYDLSGRKVQKPTKKGVYIQEGRKIVK